MRITRSSVFTCLALLALVGCEKAEETTNDENGRLAPSAQDKNPAISTNAAILSVNGIAYTQADWDADIAMRETLFLNKRGGFGTKDQKKLAKQREGLETACLVSFVNEVLWNRSVGDAGAAIRKDDLYKKILEDKQAKFERTFCKKGQTFADLEKLFKDESQTKRFHKMIALEAEQEAYCVSNYSNEYTVTSNAVMDAIAQAVKVNEYVPVTNAAIFASASNLVTRARAGEDFAKLADEYSQDEQKEAGGVMGECDESDFPLDAEKLWPILKEMKVGEISDVLDTEEGLCIFKCNKVVPESEKTGEFALDLSRIVLYKIMYYEIPTYEQCKRDFERESRQEVMGKILAKARGELKIELPQGASALPQSFIRSFRKFIEFPKKPVVTNTQTNQVEKAK